MKVLVVEDETRIAHYIKKGLEQKAMVVDVATDGELGLDLATTQIYDVIVLDIMVPKRSGLEVCQELRNQGIHTPILMLTARGLVEDRVSGLEAGADDYLAKPFAFVELIARVKALARRPARALPKVLTVTDLQLDTQTYQARRADQPISLSSKEYSLLEFLMRHKGQVFSKEHLLEQVWPYDSEALPNTVQVYIGYLRDKIDRAFPNHVPLIQTVRGFGYKIG